MSRRRIGRIKFCPFTLLVSSNERAHGSDYRFEQIPARLTDGGGLVAVPIEFVALKTGDYSIYGYEQRVCVERKTLEDLYGSLGHDRERFAREFDRLAEMEYAAVVIEAGWHEIVQPHRFRPKWQSEMHPRAVWGTIFSWAQDYRNIHWFAMGSRRLGEMATFEILEMFWRKHHGEAVEAEIAAENAALPDVQNVG